MKTGRLGQALLCILILLGKTTFSQQNPARGFGDSVFSAAASLLPAWANAGADKSICKGEEVTIGIPATEGIIYHWSPASGLAQPNNSKTIAFPQHSTTYVLTTTSLESGLSFTDTVRILVRELPVGNITASNPAICEGASVTLSAPDARSYQWFRNGSFINGATDTVLVVTSPGNYTVNFDVNGCTNFSDNSISLTLIKKPSADFSFDKYCVGMTTSFTSRAQVQNSGPVNYEWTVGNETVAGKNFSKSFGLAKDFEVKFAVIPEFCPNLAATVTKTVSMEEALPGIAYAPLNAFQDRATPLKAREIGSSYQWMPSLFLSSSSSAQTSFTGNNQQLYTVRITRPSGCVTIDSQLVRLFKDRDILVPTGFTPNADGRNDRIRPVLVGMRELKVFRIMNRWGMAVYESRTDLPGWDGYLKGALQPAGTYVWEALAIDNDGNQVSRKGSFVLIR